MNRRAFLKGGFSALFAGALGLVFGAVPAKPGGVRRWFYGRRRVTTYLCHRSAEIPAFDYTSTEIEERFGPCVTLSDAAPIELKGDHIVVMSRLPTKCRVYGPDGRQFLYCYEIRLTAIPHDITRADFILGEPGEFGRFYRAYCIGPKIASDDEVAGYGDGLEWEPAGHPRRKGRIEYTFDPPSNPDRKWRAVGGTMAPSQLRNFMK